MKPATASASVAALGRSGRSDRGRVLLNCVGHLDPLVNCQYPRQVGMGRVIL